MIAQYRRNCRIWALHIEAQGAQAQTLYMSCHYGYKLNQNRFPEQVGNLSEHARESNNMAANLF